MAEIALAIIGGIGAATGIANTVVGAVKKPKQQNIDTRNPLSIGNIGISNDLSMPTGPAQLEPLQQVQAPQNNYSLGNFGNFNQGNMVDFLNSLR